MSLKLLLLSGLIGLSATAFAQDSLRVQPSPSLSPGQSENAGELKKDEKEQRVEVAEEKIPASMKRILDGDEKYSGWREGGVFYESSSDQYLVHIVKDNATRTYRFDKSGEPIITDRPVTTDETRH
jgi:hypothetical protein